MEIDPHDYKRKIEASILSIKKSKKISVNNKKVLDDYYNELLNIRLDKLPTISQKLGCFKQVALELKNTSMKNLSKKQVKDLFIKFNGKNVCQKFIKTFCNQYLKKPGFVNGLKIKNKDMEPKDFVTEEDVMKMINASNYTRDKALISLLYESGCRAGEILKLRIKDINFEDDDIEIRVNGKTGARQVYILGYAKFLVDWVTNHPNKDNPDAPLWPVIFHGGGQVKNYVDYPALRMLLIRLKKKCGIKNNVNPHAFRHSRASYWAKNNLNESLRSSYFGWKPGSKIPGRYTHLFGPDVKKVYRALHGLENKTDNSSTIIICGRCKRINPKTLTLCNTCGYPLTDKEILNKIEKQKGMEENMARMQKDIKRLLEEAGYTEPEIQGEEIDIDSLSDEKFIA